jgi:hypothetical protein
MRFEVGSRLNGEDRRSLAGRGASLSSLSSDIRGDGRWSSFRIGTRLTPACFNRLLKGYHRGVEGPAFGCDSNLDRLIKEIADAA